VQIQSYCQRAIAYLKPEPLPISERSVPSKHLPVARSLKNGLLALYVVDEGDAFTFVQQRHVSEAEIALDDLHALALQNLATRAKGNVVIRREGRLYSVLLDGNLDASLLLLDELWESAFAGFVSGSFAVAVPARDVLAFCDADSAQGLAELRALISHVQGAGEHLISDRIYLREGRGIWAGRSDA
jgi:uncharacterized protein YtpQ (UPF0354 family)